MRQDFIKTLQWICYCMGSKWSQARTILITKCFVPLTSAPPLVSLMMPVVALSQRQKTQDGAFHLDRKEKQP